MLLPLGVVLLSGCNILINGDRSTYLLAYHERYFEGNFVVDEGVYLIDGNGKWLQRITNPDLQAFSSAWSPDGSQLAFVGRPKAEVFTTDGLYILDLSSQEYERITAPREILVDDRVSWSPDGKSIVFSGSPVGSSNTGLYIVNVDSKQVAKISDELWHPQWSPTANLIVAISEDAVCLLSLPGGTSDCFKDDELSTHFYSITYPFWSPDGSRIGFVASTRDGFALYSMRTDGSDLQELFDQLGTASCYPDWSVDGRFIVLGSCSEGRHDLYILDLDTRRLNQLTTNGQSDHPAWKPVQQP
jgi:Tol biopolymer transport system component